MTHSAVVVAHPDDEALWLSSVLGSAERVVFCFGDLFDRPKTSAARRNAVASLPLRELIDLRIPESGGSLTVDWAQPHLTETGIALADPAASERYVANFPVLVEALRTALAGCTNVYTHNPWGEYGHADHIQVHCAIAALQDELGYTMWFSNYVGMASWRLAQALATQPLWTVKRTVVPDVKLAQALKQVYRRNGAWTWNRWHRWPDEEVLYAMPPGGTAPRHAFNGEQLLDVAGLRWWPPRGQALRVLRP
jgi:LmbE family N-acetylglucosaminyl deacetylase